MAAVVSMIAMIAGVDFMGGSAMTPTSSEVSVA